VGDEKVKDYKRSAFYRPVLKSLAPRWHLVQGISALGILPSMFILPWLISAWCVVPLILSVTFLIVATKKIGRHAPTALRITEKLSDEWFNRNVYGPQAKRELEQEISRQKALERNMPNRPRGPVLNNAGGGSMHGARGEDLF
jgi:hypothetical protein